MMDIQKRFDEFKQAGYASRVSPDHVLNLYLGLDEQSHKMIEFRGVFTPRKINSTSSINVSHFTRPEYKTLRFTLLDEEMSGLFFVFCNDLIEQTQGLPDASAGYKAVTNRFFQWKQMFVGSKKKRLTEFEIMGLIGELLFIRDWLSGRVGYSDAIHSWSGQEMTNKDFSFEKTWYEIKAVSRGKTTVRISSLEQLDSSSDGELVIIPLERMSEEFRGITLNKLVVEIRSLISDEEDKELFMRKIALQGYEYNNYYDDFVYVADNPRRYRVTSSFPRLTRSQVPSSVANCIYDLLIRDLEPFHIKEEAQ